MQPSLPLIRLILDLLAATPGRISAAAGGMSQARLARRPGPNDWSVVEILAHLRACADVWGSTIESMLSNEAPSLPDIHPRMYIKQTPYPSLDFRDSLKAFSRQRQKLLRTLKSLRFDDWSRGPLIGNRRHTVFSQARRMAKHEMEHAARIELLLSQLGK